jgi:hypothetical protein
MPRSIRLKFCENHIVTLTMVGLFLGGCHGSGDNSAGLAANRSEAGTCSDPILIEGNAKLDAQTTNKGADGVSGDDSSCVGYATHGADRVYKTTLTAKDKNKLRVVVTPTDTASPDAFDPVVYATKDCVAQPTCTAGQDIHGGGGQESFDFVNTTGQDESLYVVVDGYDFQPNGGSYQLAAEFTTSP